MGSVLGFPLYYVVFPFWTDQVLNIVNAVRKKPVAPEQVRPEKKESGSGVGREGGISVCFFVF